MKTVSQFSYWLGGLAAVLLTLSGGPAIGMDATIGGALPAPLPLFPAVSWWNLDISAWTVDPNSASYISFINNGGTHHLHPDFGGNAPTPQDPYACYGMPYAVVSGVSSADLVPVEFSYADESDGVDHATNTSFPFYPIPAQAITQPYWIEGCDPGNVDLRGSQDRHLLIVDSERNYLYELYNVYFNPTQGRWYGGSGAFFDMNTNDRRPEGWTSADAAGLAILPGLVRYDEIYDDAAVPEIQHAFRVTVRATQGHVYPASHSAGSTSGALPTVPANAIVSAGASSATFPIATTPVAASVTATISASYAGITKTTAVTINPPVPSSLTLSPSTVNAGSSSTGTVTLNGPAPAGGKVVALSSSKPSVASVPASVTVPAGSSSATFIVTTSPGSSNTSVTVSATAGGVTKSATLSIRKRRR